MPRKIMIRTEPVVSLKDLFFRYSPKLDASAATFVEKNTNPSDRYELT